MDIESKLNALRLEVVEAINILAMCGDKTPVNQLGEKLCKALNASAAPVPAMPIPKQEPAGAVPDEARSFPRYLSVEARIKWKERWDKNYSANPDAMWSLFWESVSHEEAPITSPRITENGEHEYKAKVRGCNSICFGCACDCINLEDMRS